MVSTVNTHIKDLLLNPVADRAGDHASLSCVALSVSILFRAETIRTMCDLH